MSWREPAKSFRLKFKDFGAHPEFGLDDLQRICDQSGERFGHCANQQVDAAGQIVAFA